MHECSAHPSQFRVVHEIYGSAISIETGDRGVFVRGMHGAVWIAPTHNKLNGISVPPYV